MKLAAALALALANAATANANALPWMENDLDAALARSAAEHKPVFVDVWAPWCHACLSMTEFVFADKSLGAYADKFVWLEMDTETPKAASFLARFTVDGWPTYLVLDAKGAVQDRALGSLSLPELTALLARDSGGKALSAQDGLLHEAVLALAAGDAAGAERKAMASLAAAKEPWGRRAEALDLVVNSLAKRDLNGECALGAELVLPQLGRSDFALDAAVTGAGCAMKLDGKDARRGPRLTSLAAALEGVLAEPTKLAVDDRSDGWATLSEARDALGDKAGARAAMASRKAMLEKAAAAAKTPAARDVFEAHRVDTYLELGEPQAALPMLTQSEKDAPDDYNHPARMALVLLKLGKADAALPEVERAIKLCQGPRLLRYYTLKADIEKARGDQAAEAEAVRQAKAAFDALPKEHQALAKRAMESLEKRLAAPAKS